MYLQLVYNYTHLLLTPSLSLPPSLSSCLCVLKVADRLLTCDDISLSLFVDPLKLFELC